MHQKKGRRLGCFGKSGHRIVGEWGYALIGHVRRESVRKEWELVDK